jgi:hypothetical protein
MIMSTFFFRRLKVKMAALALGLGLLILVVPTVHAQITYNGGNPICTNSTSTVTPMITMGMGNISGTFSVVFPPSPTATLVNFNAAAGSFTPQGNPAGTYLIRFEGTYPGSMGNDTLFILMRLDTFATKLPITFSYPGGPFCLSAQDPLPQLTGNTNGNFTSTNLTVDFNTGAIDLSMGPLGNSDVMYTYTSPLGACAASLTANVTLTGRPDSSFAYTFNNSKNQFCLDGGSTTPILPPGLGTSFFSSSPTNILASNTTGQINLNNSLNPGVYTITHTRSLNGCSTIASTSVTLEAAPTASFQYSRTTFCISAPDEVPLLTGTRGGNFFSSSPALSVDSTSGLLQFGQSSPVMMATVSYAYASPLGACRDTATTTVTVEGPPDPSFQYGKQIFCSNETDPIAEDLGGNAITNGNFSVSSVTPGNTLQLNPSTGAIDLDQSDAGGYIITNTLAANGCSQTASFSITIVTFASSNFSYPRSPYCQSDPDPRATITGQSGGSFSSTNANLVFLDTVTGEIDLSQTPPGNYPVTYQSPGGCGTPFNSTIQVLAATPQPNSMLSAPGICIGEPLPSLSFSPGLTNPRFYSSLSPLTPLNINPVPLTLQTLGFDNNTSGLQRVFVTDSAAGFCVSIFDTISLNVSPRPTVSLSSAPSPAVLCEGESFTLITTSTGANTFQLTKNGSNVGVQNATGVFQVNDADSLDVFRVVANPGGCDATSGPIVATVAPAPTFTFSSPPPFIIGPTSPPLSLNSLITSQNPSTATLVFSASRGINSMGSNYFFDPSDPAINSMARDTVRVSLRLTGPAPLNCSLDSIFEIIVDPSSQLSTALTDASTNQTIRAAYCNDDDPIMINLDLTSFTPNTTLCDFTIRDASGNPVTPSPLQQMGTNGNITSFRFDPSAFTSPGQYSFQLRSGINPTSCAPRGGFFFTIKPVPNNPLVQAPANPFCEGAVNDTLRIINRQGGVGYNWFTDTIMSALNNTPIMNGLFITGDSTRSAPANNQKTYYVRAELNQCASPRFGSARFTIYPLPPPATVFPPADTFCGGTPLPILQVQTTIAGQNLQFNWYDDQDSLLRIQRSTNFNPTPFVNITSSGSQTFQVVQRTFSSPTFGGCFSLDSATRVTLTQIEKPNPPTLLGPRLRQLCQFQEADPDTLRATPSGSVSTFSWWADASLNTLAFQGFSIPGDTLPIDVNVLGPDTVFVTSTFQGCQSDPVFFAFNVNSVPPVSFSGLDPEVCTGADSIRLLDPLSPYDPQNAEFLLLRERDPLLIDTLINAINGNVLLPDSSGAGDFFVIYRFTDNNGCVGTAIDSVRINPSPDAAFTRSGQCVGDTFRLQDRSVFTVAGSGPADSITNWEWDFFTFTERGVSEVVVDSFPNAGPVEIILEVTSNRGCTDTAVANIFIGSKPEGDFSWTNQCEGDTTRFTGRTANLRADETLESALWNYGGGFVGSDSADNRLAFGSNIFSPGTYDVALVLTSQQRGGSNLCRDTVRHKVYIHPTVQVTPELGYFENFDTTNHGWLAQNIFSKEFEPTDWELAWPDSPGGIDSPKSPPNSWITQDSSTFSPGEQSWVVSPCFDLRSLNRPMIGLDIWSHTQDGRDGAVVEATIDDGDTWTVLGPLKEDQTSGLNWYNQNTISAKPGEQPFGFGWSGVDTSWSQARHKLDEFIGMEKVRFRVAFGSDENHAPAGRPQDSLFDIGFDGFAFDNFFIRERERAVLLEHFTNLRVAGTDAQRAAIYGLNQRYNNALDIIPLQYHVDFSRRGDPPPALDDPINLLNTDDPEARAFQYAIPYVGRVAINGNMYYDASFFAPDPDSLIKLIRHQSLIDRLSLEEPKFSIALDNVSGIRGDSVVIQARVTARDSSSKGEEVFVFFAVVEDSVRQSGRLLRSVMRKLIPNNGGVPFFPGRDWVPASSQTFRVAWPLADVAFSDTGQLSVLVFVQDKGTNQVHQAVSSRPKGSGVPSPPLQVELGEAALGIEVYPNPTHGTLYVVPPEASRGAISWRMLDMQGKVLRQGSFENPRSLPYQISLQSLSGGVYYLHFRGQKGRKTIKKVVKIN